LSRTREHSGGTKGDDDVELEITVRCKSSFSVSWSSAVSCFWLMSSSLIIISMNSISTAESLGGYHLFIVESEELSCVGETTEQGFRCYDVSSPVACAMCITDGLATLRTRHPRMDHGAQGIHKGEPLRIDRENVKDRAPDALSLPSPSDPQ
jgi:hypothetical protein